MLPTPYEYLARHVSHDGKPLSEGELSKQDKKLYRKMQEDERQAQQKGDSWHAKGEIRLEAEGRKLIKGFRVRQTTEISDYRKATTEVVQHILSPGTVSRGTVSKPPQQPGRSATPATRASDGWRWQPL
jgi:hypothetical protein